MKTPWSDSIFLGTGMNGQESTSRGIYAMLPKPSWPQEPPPKQKISPVSAVSTIVCTSPQEAKVSLCCLRAVTHLGIGW